MNYLSIPSSWIPFLLRSSNKGCCSIPQSSTVFPALCIHLMYLIYFWKYVRLDVCFSKLTEGGKRRPQLLIFFLLYRIQIRNLMSMWTKSKFFWCKSFENSAPVLALVPIQYVQEVVTRPKILDRTVLSNWIHVT